ncbi:putative molybdenum carrier protein [Desulfosoma caldarium]|uniref:Putative molybdenum carrier protein n=1 Tax=Desulfosoma caldarium TaxID=610254 RepID=A0A3N1V205_9BACT|nr:putative molybdenum carrier protein [Desulfosoma caldarium]ROQ93526.1 putative molybdenum carrier protein [Desulfosoma caldarium]
MSDNRDTIFEKVVSGGQTGVDRGALDAALDLGHPCGGWCPRGRRAEDGRIPDRYPLQEHASSAYRARTEANVLDSDGTLVFCRGKPSGGTALTIRLAHQHHKPCLVISLDGALDLKAMARHIRSWGESHGIRVLNVAGPRESENPGLQQLVAAVMREVLNRKEMQR